MGAVDTLHEPLACVDAELGTEFWQRMLVHPVPLARDCCAHSVWVRVGSLFAFAREVRLESTRDGKPFGVIRKHDHRRFLA
jgi:hypothetical protein